ncbi:MAG: prolyl oligopeptidase family serine peptidase [Flavisolibacter sp.]
MYKSFIVFLFLSIQAAGQPPSTGYSRTALQSSGYWIDVDYVGDGITAHMLDIHLPTIGKAPFLIVICIYGSAWFSNNSKSAIFYNGLGQRLLQQGFAVVTINHRSSGDARFPAQIQDVKAAIRFIRANSKTFSIDSNFIAITGYSSGGHLSALAGATNNTKRETINGLNIDVEGSLGKFTSSSSKVNAVVDWFGPTDFLLMDSCGSQLKHNDAKSPESSLIGGPIRENKDAVELANPINYVDKLAPPFLIFHGDKDPLVPLCESERLYDKLQEKAVISELVIVPGGGHGPGVMIDKYYDKMIAFLNNELRKRRN